MRGEPTNLAALIRWYRDVAGDDIPQRIHNRETADDGAPQWHGSFRAFMMAHPTAVDMEGHVRSPYKFWLWVMRRESRRGRVGADFLWRVAMLQGDWLTAARFITPLTDDGEVMAREYTVATLQAFWRLMQHEPRVFRKSEAQGARP